MTTLVVGRGLLGRAVVTSLRARGARVLTVDVPWHRPADAVEALVGAAHRAAADDCWRLVWSAGAGVIATSTEDLDAEVECFRGFIDKLSVPPAAMFLTSSAGGAYAGSPDQPPFTERSVAGSLSAYGRAKLDMEAVAARLAERGTRVLVGRAANLYGPGQDLGKPQGLVSQLCVAQVTGQPLMIYASMDTLRDYLFVRDAAILVTAGLDRVAAEEPGRFAVKILTSGVSRSIGSVIGESTRVFRKRPRLVLRGAGSQIMDLRLRSTFWTDLDASTGTPFVVGLRATAEDVGRRVRAGHLVDLRRG